MFYHLLANQFYTCTVGVFLEAIEDIRHSCRKLLLHMSHPLKGFEFNNKNVSAGISGSNGGRGAAPSSSFWVKKRQNKKNAEGRKAGRATKTKPTPHKKKIATFLIVTTVCLNLFAKPQHNLADKVSSIFQKETKKRDSQTQVKPFPW